MYFPGGECVRFCMMAVRRGPTVRSTSTGLCSLHACSEHSHVAKLAFVNEKEIGSMSPIVASGNSTKPNKCPSANGEAVARR